MTKKNINSKIKVFVCFLCALCIFALSCLTVFAEAGVFNWYVMRNKEHKQPVAEKNLSFISEYGGYYIDTKHGDSTEEKVVYLTFDAGYENGNVEKILDVLKNQNVKGAFFVLGNLIERDTGLVCRMFDEGHLVCNHTYSHKSMVGKSREEVQSELRRLEQTCKDLTGRELSKYYRPPEGKFDAKSLEYVNDMGYKTVFWSFAYEDWDNNRQMSPEKAKAKILDNIHNGEVLLLHPTSATNAAVLEDVIIELKDQGYRFGTLDELCG